MFEKWNRLPYLAPEDGKGGGGEGGKGQEAEGGKGEDDIEAKIAAATAGLKSTNTALKAEKQQMKEKLDSVLALVEKLGGEEGASALLEMRSRFEKDKLGKLLAEGKTDEWLQANVQNLKGEHKQTVDKMMKDVETATQRATAAESALANLHLDIAVREACTTSEGFRKGAVSDALLWAKSRFQFDHERGIPVRRDENGTVILGKDGESPLTIAEDLEQAKETRRHWWEDSQGAGASGGVGSGGADGPTVIRNVDDWRKHRTKLGMDKDYRIPG